MKCPMCTHPNRPMGTLGPTDHYRCRDCGWMYSKTRKPVPQPTAHDCLPGHNDHLRKAAK